MYKLVVPDKDCFNEATNEFVHVKGGSLKLEHSLLSISRWESKWHRSFLNSGPKNTLELVDYIRCMSVNVPPESDIFNAITYKQIKEVQDYISDPMTATTISNKRGSRPSKGIITSEIIYYWMTEYGIPFECEKWNLNRLLMLIRVCAEKNAPGKKMSQRENMQQMHALNAARKAKMHTRG